MEALQAHPGTREPLPKDKLWEWNLGVKRRLAAIPKIPSSIALPPRPQASEAAEAASTITSTTAASKPTSEPSTAATSVVLLPRVFTVQKFHVSPSVPMDEKIQRVWTQQIRVRLSKELRLSIPTGTCLQEFWMAGKRRHKLRPTLFITCGDATTKKEVEKAFKGQAWLQKLLKVNDISFIVLVVKTPLSAGPISDEDATMELSEAYAVQLLPPEATTSCGLNVLISGADGRSQKQCTLGGLLLVDGQIVGLTAAHPFSELEHNAIRRESLRAAQTMEDSEDEESSAASSEPFMFNIHDDDDDDDRYNDSTASSVSFSENAGGRSNSIDGPSQGQQDSSGALSSPMKWYVPRTAILPASVPVDVPAMDEQNGDPDWALLRTLPPAVTSLPNMIAHIDRRHDIPIQGTASSPANGEVAITIAGIGPQLGYLHSSLATMKVGESVLDVQLVTMERVLPLGSSGAWVILGDKLCGYIVATRQDVPWAYMVAIEPVLTSIRQKLGTDEVRLPTAAELKMITQSSEGSKVEPSLNEEARMFTSNGDGVIISSEGSKKVCGAEGWSTWRAELPGSDEDLPPEMPEGLVVDQEFRLVEQQKDELFNEKSETEDGPSQPWINRPAVSTREPRLEIKMSERSTTGQAMHIPVIPLTDNYCPPTSFPSFLRHEDNYTVQVTVPAIDRKRKSIFRIHMVYKIWHSVETLLLRTEYQRRKSRKRKTWLAYRITWFNAHLAHPNNEFFDVRYSDFQTTMLRDIQAFWYYLRLPFYYILDILLSFMYSFVGFFLLNPLYFVVCFPLIVWVSIRHRDVLVDGETRARQQHESIRMLGNLPYRVDDYDTQAMWERSSVGLEETYNKK